VIWFRLAGQSCKAGLLKSRDRKSRSSFCVFNSKNPADFLLTSSSVKVESSTRVNSLEPLFFVAHTTIQVNCQISLCHIFSLKGISNVLLLHFLIVADRLCTI